MELPEFVTKKLEDISKRTSIDIEQVKKDYEKFFNSDFIKEDTSFANDEDRHTYAKGVFWTRYILRKPTKPFDLIPIGVDSVRKSKATSLMNTSLFCLDTKGKIRRVSMKGDVCKEVKNIVFWSLYKGVMLGEFRDSPDLLADDRAEFEKPIKINASPMQLLEQLDIERTTIIDAKDHLSRVGSDGYVIKDDWKAIQGLVQRTNKNPEDSENEWGIVSLADETVDPEKMEPEVTASGEILPPGFTIFCSPSLLTFARDSEVLFLGPIVKNKNGQISMNGYCIVPIHLIPLEE